MAPTEESILDNFLLTPAPLPTIITLQKFTDLFPRSQRSNPQIRLLYRELQHRRGLQTDEVQANIEQEVKQGGRQRREVARARRQGERHELEGMDGREIDMEAMVSMPRNHSAVSSLMVRVALRADFEPSREQSAYVDDYSA